MNRVRPAPAAVLLRLEAVGSVPLRFLRLVIAPLALRFLEELIERQGGQVRAISPQALGALEEHEWAGNVRELRNAIERAVSLCAGSVIQMNDLPEALRLLSPKPAPLPQEEAVPTAVTLEESRDAAEVLRITEAMERNNNNRLRAAEELGISRMTLYK